MTCQRSSLNVNRSTKFVSLDTHPASNILVVTYEILVCLVDSNLHRELSRRSKRAQLQIRLNRLDRLISESQSSNNFPLQPGDLQALSRDIVTKCPLLAHSTAGDQRLIDEIQLHLLYLVNRRQTSSGNAIPRPSSSLSMIQQVSAGGQVGKQDPNQKQSVRPLSRSRRGSGGLLLRRSFWPHSAGSYREESQRSSFSRDGDPSTKTFDLYASVDAKLINSRSEDAHAQMLDDFMMDLNEILEAAELSILERCKQSELVKQIEELTSNSESSNQKTQELIDTHLEGLYGDSNERQRSMMIIRRMVNCDKHLIRMSLSKLLFRAMLRTLRDTSTIGSSATSGIPMSESDFYVCESIHYCLIRLTSYEDVNIVSDRSSGGAAGNSDELKELIRTILDTLGSHVNFLRWSKVNNKSNSDRGVNYHHYVVANSLLVLLFNIISLDDTFQIQNYIITQSDKSRALDPTESQGASGQRQGATEAGASSDDKASLKYLFVSILTDLLSFSTEQLVRDVRLQARQSRSLKLLNWLVNLLIHLSCYKEFIKQLDQANHLLTHRKPGKENERQNSDQKLSLESSICNLLNVLQQANGLGNIRSRPIFSTEIMSLELTVLELVNNLILNARFRVRLLRKNLLKFLLRNLVLFYASSSLRASSTTSKSKLNKQNILHPYESSPVILVPLRCLYELSCSPRVRAELLKSRVIMKCLLEYLISCVVQSSSKTSHHYSREKQMGDGKGRKKGWKSKSDPSDSNQILLEPTCAAHYILSIWINLSARVDAPEVFEGSGDDEESREPSSMLCNYINLAIESLVGTKATLGFEDAEDVEKRRQKLLMAYLNLKLLRNLTYFFPKKARVVPNKVREDDNGASGGGKIREDLPEKSDIDVEKWAQRLANFALSLKKRDFFSGDIESAAILDAILVESVSSLANIFGVLRSPVDMSKMQLDSLIEQILSLFASGGNHPQELITSGKPDTTVMSCTTVSFEEQDGDMDDLLLAAGLLLGHLSKFCEVCPTLLRPNDRLMCRRLLEACCAILKGRQRDHEMLITSLLALGHLLNHKEFVIALELELDQISPSSSLQFSDFSCPEGQQSCIVKLVGDLSSLLLARDQLSELRGQQAVQANMPQGLGGSLVQLANLLLVKLNLIDERRSLEEESLFVARKRFEVFNSKWLEAIRAARDEPSLDESTERLISDDWGHLRAVTPAGSAGGFDTSSGRARMTNSDRRDQWRRQVQLEPLYDDPNQADPSDYTEDLDYEDDDDDDDDDDDESSSALEPDLFVIDANSMVGHLNSHR